LFCVAKPGWTLLVLSGWWRAPNVFSLSYQIFSVQWRQLAAFSMPLSSQMLLRKQRATAKKHGYLSDSDVRSGSIVLKKAAVATQR